MGYTSPTKVARIVELQKAGRSDSNIARQVGVDRTTVPRIFTHSVLFDAPQIPAGMHPFRRIPPDSTGICWMPVEWNRNPAE